MAPARCIYVCFLCFSMKGSRKADYCTLQFRWPDLKHRLHGRSKLGPSCIPRADSEKMIPGGEVRGKSRMDNPWAQTACVQFPGDISALGLFHIAPGIANCISQGPDQNKRPKESSVPDLLETLQHCCRRHSRGRSCLPRSQL